MINSQCQTGLFLRGSPIGWAVSTVSLLIWTGLIMSVRLLSPRLPYDLVESDD